MRGIHHLVEDQALRTPDAIAIVFEDRQVTYQELNRRANQLAHRLRALGVGAETLAGLCVRRSPEMLVGMLGILKAGGAYVALDPAYPRVRLAFMIEDAAMPIVIAEQSVVDRLPGTQAKLICLESERSEIAQGPETNPRVSIDHRNLAYVLYTSGSTGRPKGVAIEHRSVVAFLDWARSVFPPEELAGTLAATSICFDLSIFEIFVPLICGGTVILSENAIALPALAARNQVTSINTVPSAMAALMNVGGVPDSVRVVNLAGEPLSNKLVQAIYRLGNVRKVYNLYGPSEDTTYSTFVLTQKGATENPSIGRPINGTQAYIVDERMEPTPDGSPGELCLGGDGLARGYLNRPELTEAKFIPNPFGEGRLYRTGDLARYRQDGDIEFLGRMDYQVKVRGFRIELGEIETALEQHPAVERAVVLVRPDSRDEPQLVAYLVAQLDALEGLAQDRDAQEHVELWRNVYEETYGETTAALDPTFKTNGWRSSYTGQAIPTEEMREWLTETVARILALQPRDVLEIGCGTGMLLARVAPHCASYMGLDISRAALDHVHAMQRELGGLDRVTLIESAADDLTGFEPHSFDTVILNSVIQHFPDAHYLVRVLKSALQLVKPGGHVFVGDVINFDLLEAFHTSMQLYRAADTDSCAQVRQRVSQQMAQERDLWIAPSFFRVLAQREPAITHLEVLPKSGRSLNQLTRFRYDSVLHIESPMEPLRDLSWLDWQRENLSVTEVRRRLCETRPEFLASRNIPNARLDDDITALSWLREAGPEEPIAQLRGYLTQQRRHGVKVDDLRALESLGYRVALSWLNTDTYGAFDAVFTRRDQARRPISFEPGRFTADANIPWAVYCNHPRRAKLGRQLIPHVRQYLQEKLPHYMIPAVFTILEKMPLSATGKIDRGALAQIPVTLEPAGVEARPANYNPMETLLAKAWAGALNLNHVGLDDNFFMLGGDSLKAMELMHHLQRELDRPFRPVTLLQAPTVAQFADWLQETYPELSAADRRSRTTMATEVAAAAAELQEGDI